jgi:hypothetical protein
METTANVKSVIEAITCPVHKQHPKIVMDGGNAVKFECCCAEFKVQCFYILTKLVEGESFDRAMSKWDNKLKN